MARPVSPIQRHEVKVRLTPELLAQLNLICLDPLTERIAYGVRNDHVENALRDYLDKYYPMKKSLPL